MEDFWSIAIVAMEVTFFMNPFMISSSNFVMLTSEFCEFSVNQSNWTLSSTWTEKRTYYICWNIIFVVYLPDTLQTILWNVSESSIQFNWSESDVFITLKYSSGKRENRKKNICSQISYHILTSYLILNFFTRSLTITHYRFMFVLLNL